MRLEQALKIFEENGPEDYSRARTKKEVATKMLSLYLTPHEMAELVIAWRKSAAEGKGVFFTKLGEVKERLLREGEL